MKKVFNTREACQQEINRRRDLLQPIPPDAIPEELRNHRQWICWKYEIGAQKNGTFRVNKTPYQAKIKKRAKTDAPATWTDFDNAFQAYTSDTFFDGIGFVFSENDEYTGIDFDNCRAPETGTIHPTVKDWCNRFGGYTEPSVSRTGGHVIIKAKLPPEFKTGFKFTKYPEADMDVEVYDKKRYFIVTGNAKSNITEIPNAQETLDQLIATYQETKGKKTRKSTQTHTKEKSDADILKKLRTGKQADKFNALWKGNWDSLYTSQSEADLALCNLLAFHTQDKAQIDRIFRQSGLYREKWERADYREETINKSIDSAKQQRRKHGTPESDNPFFTGPRGGFVIESMMQHIQDNFSLVSFFNEKGIRIYKDGIYVPDNDAILDNFIMDALAERHTPTYVENTIAQLDRRFRTSDTDSFIHPNHLNLQNGIYDIHTGEIKNHSSEFKSLIQLPVKYDPDATCPEIDTFLSDILQDNENDIQLAHEIIGVTALQQLPIPALFVLLGPTHTGKSTFIDIVTALLGTENVSGISLQALDDENMRFARAGLYGKLANMSADLSKKTLAGDSNIKKIAAGDRFDVERKGIDRFTIRPFATLICATNEMPKSRDKSDAWLERLIILPFTKQHTGDKAIRNYLDRLTTPQELSGLLNHAITGIKHVLDTGNFTITENVTQAKAQYELDNNSVTRFITENYIADSEAQTNENEIYDAYKEWHEIEGMSKSTCPTKTFFRKTLDDLGYRQRRGKHNNKRFFYFDGLRKRTTDDDLIDEIKL